MNKPTRQTLKGARYFKADLHTHSPASKDFEEKQITPEDFVQSALSKGLDIVALTDHNSAEWVDRVRLAAKKTSLIFFPGVEVSTPTCHLLAIFERDANKTILDDFLSSVDITNEKRGKEEASSAAPEIVLKQVAKFGGVAIAAHANSTNGLLRGGTGQYRMKLYHMEELSALEFKKEKDVRDFTRGKIPGYGPKACVQGSDAHSLAHIGDRYTFLKMDGVSLRGLRQAFLDHDVRVRYEWDAPLPAIHPQILSMEVSQGFFGGSRFEFHPNLNCFIGGKGTGKSTVVEFLRFCFEDVSGIKEIQTDSTGKVSALLGEGGCVTVKYIDSDGDLKTIVREHQGWKTNGIAKDELGNPTNVLAPPVFFSQGELARIASSPIAQIELLDRYLDLREENETESSAIESLRALASHLAELKQRERKLREEVEDKESGLTTSRDLYKALEKTLKTAIFSDFPKWESEDRYVSGVRNGLETLKEKFRDAVDAVQPRAQFPAKPNVDSPNYEIFHFVDEFALFLEARLSEANTAFAADVDQKLLDLQELLRTWAEQFGQKQKQYERSLEELGELDLRRAQSRLRSLRARLDTLDEKNKRLDELVQQVEKSLDQRTALLAKLSESRLRRYNKRAAKAAEWQSLFQGKIKVQISFCSDRDEYIGTLRALAKGTKIRESDLKLLAEKLPPTDLINLVLDRNPEELGRISGLKTDNCQKLFIALHSRDMSELLEMELVALPDQPEIRYEVEPSFNKTLQELSTGGKGTVIISLALIEGQMPLIIDQPEEPLDTLAIHEQIVATLRRQKDSRQFIFTTHNPNVAVGGDAELSHILQATADRGEIRASGGVDQEETNRLLLHHLEGGGLAFDLRARKYIR